MIAKIFFLFNIHNDVMTDLNFISVLKSRPKIETKKSETQSDGHNHNQYGERPNNFDVIAKHLKKK